MPHFFPGVKVEVFHGFDAGKPRHIYIRGFFDLYCTTGAGDTQAFEANAREMRPLRGERDRLAEARPVHARARRRHAAAGARPARDPVSLDVLAVVERGADSLRHDSRPVAQRTLALDRDAASEERAETVANYRALEGEYLRFATEDNILDLFPQVDMMISDTSSALNEFLLTYKPVVTFKNRRPGPQLIDIDSPEKLLPSIERALARPPELMREMRDYADSIHPYRDGRSSERVLDAVDEFIAGGARNPRRKPRNWWRKLKIRQRIGYWGPRVIGCEPVSQR